MAFRRSFRLRLKRRPELLPFHGVKGFFFRLILRIAIIAALTAFPISFLGLPPTILTLILNWFLDLL